MFQMTVHKWFMNLIEFICNKSSIIISSKSICVHFNILIMYSITLNVFGQFVRWLDRWVNKCMDGWMNDE